ncbi:MAG TPA: ABC transporter ATP-binding protein [Acholeplasmataceae bacterium]|jgi:ATP-binding cassette subfamily B protein|nr:ABC transporter ATP-binding protein [Acholeplasmataceae bacterium]
MIKKFVRYYRPHIKLFLLDMTCALSIAVIDLIFPVFTNRVLKVYIPENKINLVFVFSFALLLLFLIRFLFAYIVGYWGHVMGIRIETDMRSDLFKKLQTMDYQFFDNKQTGELLANLTSHINDVAEMSHHAPEDLFISSIMLVGSFVILLRIHWLLTLIVFVFLLFLITFSLSRRYKMLQSFRVSRRVQGELLAELENSLSGIRLTKAYTNEQYEQRKFDRMNREYRQARTNIFKQIGLFSSGNAFFISLANLGLLTFGGYFVYKKYIDTVDLTTYFLYINFLISPIQRLINSMEQLQSGFSGIEKFYQLMKVKPKILSPENAIVKTDIKGDIEFRNVEFRYNQDDNEYVLSNFNLSIPAGKRVALVGETGAGKTTVSKLVPRFYDVESGEILIDGINVKEYDLYCLRQAIGIVQQDVFIFWGTIKENILYGRPDATFEEVVEAAKKAKIHDFIMSLEDGYDTLTGERGVKLSGGQQQRISIARLFLKNPRILILDEATSSLDNITENMIQESFEELSRGKTTIMIAHRLSTIQNADEIIVISKKGIEERGTHKELIARGGYYADLYNASVYK